ncbi:MAG: hypothetical protein ABI384_10005 [Allobranchiibius sp.]
MTRVPVQDFPPVDAEHAQARAYFDDRRPPRASGQLELPTRG